MKRNSRFLLIINLISLNLVVTAAVLWMLSVPKTAVFATTPPEHLPQGQFAARIYYDAIADIARLDGVDLWEYNNLEEEYVLAGVDALIFAELEREGWRVEVDDLATAQLRPSEALFRPFSRTGNTIHGGYRTVSEVVTLLNQHHVQYASIAELVDYGDAYCKTTGDCETLGGEVIPAHDLLALRISNEEISGTSTISDSTIISGTKPVFFLLANIHARELPTPEIALFFADWLLDGYGDDPQATWLVDHHEVWIVPMANPDGHWLVELGDLPSYGGFPFSQRKNSNRLNSSDDGGFCGSWPPSTGGQYGVDLNRNHSFAWGGAGTSTSPCSLNFRGLTQASEPEVAQLEELVRSLFQDQRGSNLEDAAPADTTGMFISMHSYSDLVLWPWGHSEDEAPNRAGLKAIGDALASLNGYTSCQPTDCLYAASGTSDDWAYGELGIPAFTFEIGDRGDHFFPPYSTVVNEHWPENLPALRYAATIARTPYQTVLGPKLISETAVFNNDSVTITAVFSDSDPIKNVTLSLNAPEWVSDTTTFGMLPQDGTFDEGLETAVLTLPLAMLETEAKIEGNDARTLFLLSAIDEAGNEGAIEAMWGNWAVEPPVLDETVFVPFLVASAPLSEVRKPKPDSFGMRNTEYAIRITKHPHP